VLPRVHALFPNILPLEATPAGHHAPNLARAGASEEDNDA